MPSQCGSREVWPPGLHLGHFWRTIQLQSSLWDWLRPLPQLLHGSTFPSAQSCSLSFRTGHVLPMQKRVNLAARDYYPLKHLLITLALGWPGNLGFSRVYAIPRTDKSSSLCLNCCRNNVMYAKYLLSFWESGFRYVRGQRYLCDQRPIKNLGTESLMSFPSGHHFACAATQVLCDSMGREAEACAWFPQDFIPCTFSPLLVFLYILLL